MGLYPFIGLSYGFSVAIVAAVAPEANVIVPVIQSSLMGSSFSILIRC